MAGGFPVDLVLFAMIALFLVLRLRSILGRRTGYERPPQIMRRAGAPGIDGRLADRPEGPIIEGKAEAPPAARNRVLPDPASPLGLTLQRFRGIERGFDPARFLDGAEQAFRIIVGAYAAGDRITLRRLLEDESYAGFEGAIATRETRHETQRTEIRSIERIAIEDAALHDDIMALISVRIVSDQVNVTLGADGHVVAGTDAVTEITDLWTFERKLGTPDPTWRLVAARSA